MRLLFYMKITLAFIILLLAFIPAHSQNSFTTKYLGIENGLSNNVVTAIFRDHNGFMWFGTYDGLNKYDGYGFKVFRNIIGDSNSINSNIINKIDEDYQHNLWIGGQRDVSVYNPVTAKFSTPSYILSNGELKRSLKDNVVEVKVVDKDNILIGTEHNGLFYFGKNDTGKQVTCIDDGKSVEDYYVSAITYDSLQKIAYIFIQNRGLFVYTPATHQLVKKNSTIQNANNLLYDHEGNLWLGGNNGLHVYDSKTNSFSASYVPNKTSVTSLLEDREGRLWIASDGSGIFLLQRRQKMAIPFASIYQDGGLQIKSNSIYSIFEDGQKRKWIGTLRGGVNILEPKSKAI